MKSKKNIIKLLALHKNDVGSTEVQIGILSEKIKYKESYLKNLTKECFTKGYLTNSIKGVAGGNLTNKSLKFLNSL